MKINKLIVVTLLLSLSGLVASQSAGDYEAPRTEWGQPDLQGVWNFSSDIPMQRPQRYGTQEFLTQDEIQERRDAIMAGRAAADAAAARINVPDVPDEGSNPGGYNDFWFETAGLGDVVRTSTLSIQKMDVSRTMLKVPKCSLVVLDPMFLVIAQSGMWLGESIKTGPRIAGFRSDV